MFEDDEVNSFNTNQFKSCCSFCGHEIEQFPASSIDNKFKFCDLICAKLYYDNNERFTFDVKRYNNYYNEGQLSEQAKELYERCRFILFEQLPVYKPTDSDPAKGDPNLMRKVYDKVLSPVLFEAIGAYE